MKGVVKNTFIHFGQRDGHTLPEVDDFNFIDDLGWKRQLSEPSPTSRWGAPVPPQWPHLLLPIHNDCDDDEGKSASTNGNSTSEPEVEPPGISPNHAAESSLDFDLAVPKTGLARQITDMSAASIDMSLARQITDMSIADFCRQETELPWPTWQDSQVAPTGVKRNDDWQGTISSHNFMAARASPLTFGYGGGAPYVAESVGKVSKAKHQQNAVATKMQETATNPPAESNPAAAKRNRNRRKAKSLITQAQHAQQRQQALTQQLGGVAPAGKAQQNMDAGHKFCPSCGGALQMHFRFCHFCGMSMAKVEMP